jgi:hypothetical protein
MVLGELGCPEPARRPATLYQTQGLEAVNLRLATAKVLKDSMVTPEGCVKSSYFGVFSRLALAAGLGWLKSEVCF